MPANTEMAHCMTSHPKSEIPPDVARNTRSVLLSSMKGVLLKRFCRDYKSLVGEEFPWRKLGFRSATSLLQAMTDVARFEFSKKDGDYKVYGIADGMVYTPSWFVKAQGKDNYLLTPFPELSQPQLHCLQYGGLAVWKIYSDCQDVG